MFEEDCQDSLIVEAINRRDTKAAQEIKESAQHIHQQLKYAIALLEECHKVLPACPTPIGAWADCGCLHCRVELFISRNSIR